MLHLVIANKNYSSWSARPWLLLTELGIPFEEIQIKFNTTEWEIELPALSPTRRVPVLWEGAPKNGVVTYDSLAIVERIHELFPEKNVLPKDPLARARARSLMAAFHSGFQDFREAMPMNIRASYKGFGHTEQCLKEIDELSKLLVEAKQTYGSHGPFIFGEYSAADAFFTPVNSRFKTYGYVSEYSDIQELQDTLLTTESMKLWVKGALDEQDFVAEDEPYTVKQESDSSK